MNEYDFFEVIVAPSAGDAYEMVGTTGVGLGLAEALGDGLGDGDALALAVGDGEALAVTDGDGVGESVDVALGEGASVAVAVGDGVDVAAGDDCEDVCSKQPCARSAKLTASMLELTIENRVFALFK